MQKVQDSHNNRVDPDLGHYKVIPEDIIPEMKFTYEISDLGTMRRLSVNKRNKQTKYIEIKCPMQSTGNKNSSKSCYQRIAFSYYLGCGNCEHCLNVKDEDRVIKRSITKLVPHPNEDPNAFKTKIKTKCEETKKKTMHYRLHTLVAHMFIEKIPGKILIDHIDGNGSNNAVSNLRWASPSDNAVNRKNKKNITIVRGKYIVQFCKHGQKYLEKFDNKDKAIIYRNETDIELNGGFAIEVPHDIILTKV